jgi:hypothetical protein
MFILQVDYTSSSSEDNSPINPLGYSASSSVSSFDQDVFNPSHLAVAHRYAEQWQSQTQPYDPPSLAPLNISVPDSIYSPDVLPMHAPVPRSHMMPSAELYPPTDLIPSPTTRQLTPLQNTTSESGASAAAPKHAFPQQPSLLDDYPQLMFPTPSELLHDLTQQDDAVAQARDETDAETKFESQRKARHRALAESVGFTPTDP